MWERLNALFAEERKNGVLAISQVPGAITAHPPGYIDREHHGLKVVSGGFTMSGGELLMQHLGLPYALERIGPPTGEAVAQTCDLFRAEGLTAY
jgi:hypothetical protein